MLASDISLISLPHVDSKTTLNAPTITQPEEIWSRILQDVSSKNNSVTQGSVIFLGNDNSGKSSLIFRMTKDERQNCSSVLEYNYLVVHADPDDSYAYQLGGGTGLGPAETANLPLWTLDGKEELAPLLRFTFPTQLAKCAVVLCVSLDQPGDILPTLRKWYRVVDEQIRAFYSANEIEQARQMQLRFWQEYIEPLDSSLHMESASRLEIDPVLLPPEAGVLDVNCGAAIIVAITKSDLYTELGADANKVQYHVRQFCLEHGAALVYTSAKEEKNTKLLYKYLAHRVFSLPFTHPAYIVENDSIFIPSGWDSEQKLNIIRETIDNPDVALLPQGDYSQPAGGGSGAQSARSNIVGDSNADVEDEQSFLQRLHTALQETALAPPTGGMTPKRSGDATTGSLSSSVPPTGLSSSASAGKNLAAQTDNSALASFFNSLLKKDPGSAPKTPIVNSDAASHFQKMLVKSSVSASSSKIAAAGKSDTPSADAPPPQSDAAAGDEEETATESDISSAGSARTPRDPET